MIRFFRLPRLMRMLYPEALFRVEGGGREVFLTFDDGPDAAVTPIVLDVLRRHGVKATFFCTGSAVETNPALYRTILEDGHSVGNHGYSHIKGWLTAVSGYTDNAFKAERLIESRLYRPPFGSIRPKQYSELRKHFIIVFWDLILYDFDASFGRDRILKTLRRKIRPGSIVVLHDTSKSSVATLLEEAIVYLRSEGYTFPIFPAR
jgi:peptidoglycan-N-acetylglucosamine deacetylase